MKKWLFLLVLGCVAFCLSPSKRALPFLAFDASMRKSNPAFTTLYTTKYGKQWKTVKNLYEKHLCVKPSTNPRIPKIIHQIWLGGSLPEKYKPLQKSWMDRHPDWTYRLWTDDDVPHFPFVNRERFEKAINVGEKADIFRYEILNRHGGLYVDTDFECIRPVDSLHHMCDFYTGILGAYTTNQEVAIGNSLIGSIPNHPILQYCLSLIAQKPIGTTADEVQSVSGPGCFRRAFFKRCEQGNFHNVAFPFTFFFPLPPHERCGHLDEVAKLQWIEPETFGIHYWDTSWTE